ncbi:50S ribosomal protein L9 [Altericista sp. CCNU0014]|uniref:50S ribosomal protein L9 n=1 Tax=Altericista sp. CCNU0014 TaxID=3082949 RepID=UPI00384B9D63
MAKRVQLVLNQDVLKLGRLGDVVEVAPGYARNYLVPQGMAFKATPGVLKQMERRRAEELKRLAELKKQAEAQKETLAKVGALTIAQKAGEGDTLFGSVTAADIAAALQEASGIEIDRRSLTAPEIRKLGTYTADLKLHPEVLLQVTVEVVAEA